MCLLVSVRHVAAHPDGHHHHGFSIQISIYLGKTFLRISRIRIIPLTWNLVRVFAYITPFISQILDFICSERFWSLFWSILNGWHWKPAIKSFIVSVLPLFERHLYSGKRDSFSSFRNLGLTSIQGIPQHSKTVFLITKSVDNFRCVQVTMTSALTEMNYTVKDPINASMRRSRNWTVVKSVCETVSKHWLIDCEAS